MWVYGVLSTATSTKTTLVFVVVVLWVSSQYCRYCECLTLTSSFPTSSTILGVVNKRTPYNHFSFFLSIQEQQRRRRHHPGSTDTLWSLHATSSSTDSGGGNNDDVDYLLSSGGKKSQSSSSSSKTTGVYVRPSGAIERGSGFFVPGLEGPRVRLVFGTVLLVLTGVNHFLGNNMGMITTSSSGSNDEVLDSIGGLVTAAITATVTTTTTTASTLSPSSFEEILAITYSLLILFQAAIEYTKELRQAGGTTTIAATVIRRTDKNSNNIVLDQQWDEKIVATGIDDEYRSNVQWAAASYMSMTPATQILLLTSELPSSSLSSRTSARSSIPPTILYRLGREKEGSGGSNDEKDLQREEGIVAALQELRKSKGGRISLPLTHPTVQALITISSNTNVEREENKNNNNGSIPGGIGTGNPRTVILQRITDNSCWLVVSNQLLACFTRDDLKWLGQLAIFVSK
jgi:hypothetical protein